ncbi:hypothetical protein DFH07DRAFT_541018 [Mycena maculata]|uniref:Uncharacterized protein n=1 Tax=Mycena maculata TaxID=230809 RepID=A0AAD7K600_9AGAR|nr:hypothetical protein DFH07DRAFT_541018 [Mycena maculata]
MLCGAGWRTGSTVQPRRNEWSYSIVKAWYLTSWSCNCSPSWQAIWRPNQAPRNLPLHLIDWHDVHQPLLIDCDQQYIAFSRVRRLTSKKPHCSVVGNSRATYLLPNTLRNPRRQIYLGRSRKEGCSSGLSIESRRDPEPQSFAPTLPRRVCLFSEMPGPKSGKWISSTQLCCPAYWMMVHGHDLSRALAVFVPAAPQRVTVKIDQSKMSMERCASPQQHVFFRRRVQGKRRASFARVSSVGDVQMTARHFSIRFGRSSVY